MNLPPLPSPGLEHWSIEPFAPPGLESVDRLRPASAPYANPDPQAPALVLVPGLNMDARGYVRQLQLGAIADVHTLQANNEAVPGEEDFGHFARHVEEYVIAQKLQERPGGFVLGGSSMGGAVSIAICARGRIKPRALVLIGSFANCIHLPGWQRFLAPMSWVLPFNLANRALRVLGGVTRRIKSTISQDLRYIGLGYIQRTHGYFGRAVMALTRQNQIPKARKFKLPTPVVHGTEDWVLPYSAGVEMAENIPGAKLATIDGAGHVLFYTHAERVNTEIAEFLKKL